MPRMLLRRGEVMETLGVCKEKVRDMVSCGLLHEVFLCRDKKGRPQGQARFCRCEVERLAGKM